MVDEGSKAIIHHEVQRSRSSSLLVGPISINRGVMFDPAEPMDPPDLGRSPGRAGIIPCWSGLGGLWVVDCCDRTIMPCWIQKLPGWETRDQGCCARISQT